MIIKDLDMLIQHPNCILSKNVLELFFKLTDFNTIVQFCNSSKNYRFFSAFEDSERIGIEKQMHKFPDLKDRVKWLSIDAIETLRDIDIYYSLHINSLLTSEAGFTKLFNLIRLTCAKVYCSLYMVGIENSVFPVDAFVANVKQLNGFTVEDCNIVPSSRVENYSIRRIHAGIAKVLSDPAMLFYDISMSFKLNV